MAIIALDMTSRVPIFEQINRRFIELILKGVLSENDQLPSVRSLALDLGVNPNTVSRSYAELEKSGMIYSISGRGSFVAKKDEKSIHEFLLSDFDFAITEAVHAGFDEQTLVEHLKNKIEEVSKND